jgi:hypothetical protein
LSGFLIRRKYSSTFVRKSFKNAADYVIRRFNAFSAGLKKLVGLDLRCAVNVPSFVAVARYAPASTWRTLVAHCDNPILRAFYRRLRAAGKPAEKTITTH